MHDRSRIACDARSLSRLGPRWLPRELRLEHRLVLQASPFRTLAAEIDGEASDVWHDKGALDQIDPELALVVGDFDPRFGWSAEGNPWVSITPPFERFVALLGLQGS